MASQHLLITLSLVALIPYSIVALTNETDIMPSGCSNSDARLLTKDIIGVTIKEIRHARDLVGSVPRLRIVKIHATTGIQNCVEGLYDCLSDIRTVLYRLRHLKSIRQDADSLQALIPGLVSYSNVCHSAENDLGAMMVKIVDMKINDSKFLLQNVLHLVSSLEQE